MEVSRVDNALLACTPERIRPHMSNVVDNENHAYRSEDLKSMDFSSLLRKRIAAMGQEYPLLEMELRSSRPQFSANSALDTFLKTQDFAKGTLTDDTRVSRHQDSQIADQIIISNKTLVPLCISEDIINSSMEPLPLRTPTIPNQRMPRHCIISAALLKSNYLLLRAVRNLYPEAEFIERDFQIILTQNTEEADMIISPATGLVLTTIQSIKQRSLPGQPVRDRIRERIGTLSKRYERLFVLISHSSARGLAPASFPDVLDDSDCEAIANISAFSSALESGVQVIYVASGDEELAKWIAGVIAYYGVDAGSDGSLGEIAQDETKVSPKKF